MCALWDISLYWEFAPGEELSPGGHSFMIIYVRMYVWVFLMRIIRLMKSYFYIYLLCFDYNCSSYYWLLIKSNSPHPHLIIIQEWVHVMIRSRNRARLSPIIHDSAPGLGFHKCSQDGLRNNYREDPWITKGEIINNQDVASISQS